MEINPKISRSSVYRCFVKEEINQIPQEKKDRAKKFKEYETPFTPKTNGMVEPVNRTIKNNIILKNQYQWLDEMKNDLTKFLSFYNFNRRQGSIRKKLNLKTPFNAIEKWYQLKPEIFKRTPYQFKNNILNLNQN